MDEKIADEKPKEFFNLMFCGSYRNMCMNTFKKAMQSASADSKQ